MLVTLTFPFAALRRCWVPHLFFRIPATTSRLPPRTYEHAPYMRRRLLTSPHIPPVTTTCLSQRSFAVRLHPPQRMPPAYTSAWPRGLLIPPLRTTCMPFSRYWPVRQHSPFSRYALYTATLIFYWFHRTCSFSTEPLRRIDACVERCCGCFAGLPARLPVRAGDWPDTVG